jgi:hypothetical protein
MSAATVADAGQFGRARGRDVERTRPGDTRGGYDQGYRDGLRQGEIDARSGRPFGGTLFSDRREYGNGFTAGYRAAYDRQRALVNSRRQNERLRAQGRSASRGYREPAYAAGFDSGYDKGLDDGRGGDRYDPVRHRDYRDAERGYRDDYGSREAYRTNFRAGFRQGYEEGYRAGARSRR